MLQLSVAGDQVPLMRWYCTRLFCWFKADDIVAHRGRQCFRGNTQAPSCDKQGIASDAFYWDTSLQDKISELVNYNLRHVEIYNLRHVEIFVAKQ